MASQAAPTSFFGKLAARVDALDSLLCVGLDPHVKELPEPTAAAAVAFCKRLITATAEHAVAYKPNAAFFERFGAEGARALEEVVAFVPDEIPVLLDAKRGDIGSTCEAYAAACYATGATAVTLSPYMGSESLAPFTAPEPAHGAFVLCKTSNPSANELQTLQVTTSTGESRMLYEQVALLANSAWNGNGNVGLVVGATDVEAIGRVRALAPKLWILAPGVGAQGGELDPACMAGLTANGHGILFPVSRGISRAEDPSAAAAALRQATAACRAQKRADAGGAAATAAEPAVGALKDYQRRFLDFALAQQALRFGDFTLKSGRRSPYFFNAGLFSSGTAIAALGRFYAHALHAAAIDYDVIFGPAYKGIPLATTVGVALATEFGEDKGIAYNRKEAKDHGEGGSLIGSSMAGKRVLIVDDVITAGTAIREAHGIVTAVGGEVVGVVIALDRQERRSEETTESAVQAVVRELGCPVHSIVSLSVLSTFLGAHAHAAEGASDFADAVAQYRAQYGVC